MYDSTYMTYQEEAIYREEVDEWLAEAGVGEMGSCLMVIEFLFSMIIKSVGIVLDKSNGCATS